MSQHAWFLVRLVLGLDSAGQAHGAAGGAPWNPANCDDSLKFVVSCMSCDGYAMHGAKHGVMQGVCVQSTEMYRVDHSAMCQNSSQPNCSSPVPSSKPSPCTGYSS